MRALTVSYLVRQRYGYHFRMRVPEDLQEIVGLKEIRYSLKTYDGRRAKPIAQKLAEFVHQLFDDLRRGGIAVAGLSSEDINKLIREHVRKVLEEDEEYRVLGLGPKDREELDLHVENVSLLQSDYMEELALNDYKNMRGHVDVLLEEKGIDIDRGGASYKLLCREMLKAVINLLEIEMRRCGSDYSLEALPFPELLPPSPSAENRQLAYHHEEQVPRVSEVVERLVAYKRRDGEEEWTDKTEADYRAAYDRFIGIVGDLPVNEIDRKLMVNYRETLMKLPRI